MQVRILPCQPIPFEAALSENLHPTRFQPGQSGNPAGRPLGSKNHLAKLKHELEIAVRDNLRPEKIRQIIDAMCNKAINEGNVGAAKLILDKVLSNAKDTEEASEGSGTFIFQVKNLTLKHPELATEPTVDAIVVDVTPQETETVSTGAVKSNQTREQDTSGGNVVGKAPDKNVLYTPPAFMGKSGQSDNQDTNRGPGGK